MKIISWNVNGINSTLKNGHLEEIFEENPDILCVQELKTNYDLFQYIREGYNSYFYPSTKKGSGIALYTKEKPINVKYGLGIEKFDEEGRTITAEYEEFILITSYFPSGANKERLAHKFEYYDEFTKYVEDLDNEKPIIICGDLNRMAELKDAKRPEFIMNKSGFLPEEQQWFKDMFKKGFIDGYRIINPEREEYSWWSYRKDAREKNNGIRLDYFLVKGVEIEDAGILTQQMGSDHAPIYLDIPIAGKPSEKCENFIKDQKIYEEIPKDKIILLDLNYTLVSNSRSSFGRYPKRIYSQKYETELIELIKDNYVILITARPEKFKDETLAHVKRETGFEVEESYWNRFNEKPPETKEYWLNEEVFPRHGDNPEQYLAIESNPRTRRMYAKYGIQAQPKQNFLKKK